MNENNSNYNSHKWLREWPGNFCLKCGLEDPFESSNIFFDCNKCDGKGCDDCSWTGCRVEAPPIPPCS